MKKKLASVALSTLPPGDHVDALMPGLILKVGTNRRTWVVRYRQGGKRHADRLGYFPQLGLQAARTAAAALLKRVESGVPVAAVPTAVHPHSPDLLSLGRLIDRYEVMRRKEGHKVKRLSEGLDIVRRGLKQYLDLPATQFTKADLRAARDAINEGHSHIGNRLLGYTSMILQWAASEDLIAHNFARDIRRAKELPRTRTLTRAELKAIWHATFELGDRIAPRNFGRLIRFLICTAQRRNECATLRHGDLLGGIWKQTENKSGRPHRLKLPQLALDQIESGQAHEFVFPGRVGTKMAVDKLKARLDQVSGISGWRLHDLRRTGASLMQEIGVPETSIRAVLNHALPGVAGVYLRGELDQQKADALSTWAAELVRITGPRRAVS